MKHMMRIVSIVLALLILLSVTVCAEDAAPEMPQGETPQGMNPPEMPQGEMPQGGMAQGMNPPEMPQGMGNPPEMAQGGMAQGMNPPEMPQGETPQGGMAQGMNPPEMPQGGMPGGGMNAMPQSYTAVVTCDADEALEGVLTSEGKDESALLVTGGEVTLSDADVTRVSPDSTGGDTSSFYGVGAALLVTGGTLTVTDSAISTDSAGGAGVFAYGGGTAVVENTTITTRKNTSGGIHVAGGGTLIARNLTVTTDGESAAAVRSDRGGGTMLVSGGSYTSNGVGSPAVYVTADITLEQAELTATGSEALCLEGRNTVRLIDCDLTGAMQDLSQNDNTWTVIVYQSMSGDSEIGEGRFEMDGGALNSLNGGVFYTTNTRSSFVLRGVTITADEQDAYILRCTGNQNARGWGRSGQNGADCTFTAIGQSLAGDVLYDSVSELRLYLTQGSTLAGGIVDDESCAGAGGDGGCDVTIDADSVWTVTKDSRVRTLSCAGDVLDEQGRRVTIALADGTICVQGESGVTVTVDLYETDCDLRGAGTFTESALM